MGKSRVFQQYWQFLREEKKYWLIPIIVFVVVGVLMVYAQSSALAPFIYPLF